MPLFLPEGTEGGVGVISLVDASGSFIGSSSGSDGQIQLHARTDAVLSGAVAVTGAVQLGPSSANVGFVGYRETTGTGSITAISTFATIGYGALSASAPGAGSVAQFTTTGMASVYFVVTGSWTGTVTFEATVDDVNWLTVNGKMPGVTNPTGFGFGTAAPGAFRVDVAGYSAFRVRAPLASVTAITGIGVFFRGTSAKVPDAEPLMVIGSSANGGVVKNNPMVMAGTAGGKTAIVAVDTNGVQVSQTYGEAISNGLIAGGAIADRIMGQITTAATTEAAVRGTAYVEQTSNAQRSINSTSANDAAAGSGIRTVRLTYYAFSAGTMTGPFTETITLNGTTAVNTVNTNICFIEKIEALTAGSATAVAAGTIQLFAATAGGGGVIASIATGDRTTRYAHHYVPNGNICNIINMQASSTASSGNTPVFILRFRDPSATTNAEIELIAGKAIQGSQSVIGVEFDPPRDVAGPAVILFYVTPTNAASQVQRVESCFYEQ